MFDDLPSWVRLLVIGLVAGWLAALIMKERGFGVLGYLIVGVIGSFVGFFLFELAGFQPRGILAFLISAVVGAVLLIVLLRLTRRRR